MYILKLDLQKEGIINDESIRDSLCTSIKNVDNSMDKIAKTIDSIRNQTRRNELGSECYFSMKKLLEGRYLLMNNFLTERACRLVINIEEDVEIYGVENELDRVFSNLIKNSTDAYQERNSGGDINVNISKIDEDCVITIEDFAGGIEKDVADKIFEEIVSTKGIQGTGIGLFNSYQTIVGKFEGKMSFENKEGIGTTFIITIPLQTKKSKNGKSI